MKLTVGCAADLAECLRQEFQLYDIGVHIYLPGTILSPGLDEENKTKPRVLQEIEAGSKALTPAECASKLVAGLEKGHFAVTSDFDTDLLRATTSGLAPKNNFLWDGLLSVAGFVCLSISAPMVIISKMPLISSAALSVRCRIRSSGLRQTRAQGERVARRCGRQELSVAIFTLI